MNSNWAYTGDGKVFKGNDLYDLEFEFGQDLNEDGLIRPKRDLFTPSVLNYEVHDLLSTDWSKPIKDSLTSELINYYIHDSSGYLYNENSNGNLFTHTLQEGEEAYIVDLFDRVDKEIDLDFKRVANSEIADIKIFKADDNAKLLDNSDTVGFTEIINDNNNNSINVWWRNWVPDLRTNYYTEYSQLSEQESFTIAHELGHAFGLSHPREQPYAEWLNSSDTILSYNFDSISGHKALNFSDADISTLKLLWGEENDNNTSKRTNVKSGAYEFSESFTSLVKREINDNKKDSEYFHDKFDSITGIRSKNIGSRLEPYDNAKYKSNQNNISNEYMGMKINYARNSSLNSQELNDSIINFNLGTQTNYENKDEHDLLSKYKNMISKNYKNYDDFDILNSQDNSDNFKFLNPIETNNDNFI